MSLQIDFNANRWTRSDALLWIFFSDWEELRTEPNFFESMAERVTALILGEAYPCSDLHQDDEQFVQSIIEPLIEAIPVLRKTENANTLLWIRFAFTALRNGISPSNYFMNK